MLRYVGDVRDAARFTTVGLYYSEEQRSLHIDPGVALQSGRTLEILLRPGVHDLMGLPLEGGHTLRWRVSER